MNKPVIRCICNKISFKELKNISVKENVKSLEELKLKVTCANCCEFCVPYINDMLKTGETEFEIKNL